MSQNVAFYSELDTRTMTPTGEDTVPTALPSSVVGEKMEAAALLMKNQRFGACIEAYQLVSEEHPEEAGTCHGQMGAAYYFLGQYKPAIIHYKRALLLGEDAPMMRENIEEARDAMSVETSGRGWGTMFGIVAGGLFVVAMGGVACVSVGTLVWLLV